MSYSCNISFKNIEPKDVYNFFMQFKRECMSHAFEIGEEFGLLSPIFTDNKSSIIIDTTSNDELCVELIEKTKTWAINKAFKFGYFYIAAENLLGIYQVPKCMRYIFDKTLVFQNSAEHDYDFDCYDGIKMFKPIVDKYKNMSEDEIKAIYEKYFEEEWYGDGCKLEFYRKTFANEEIWNSIEYTFDAENILCISLFDEFKLSTYFEFFKGCVKRVNHFIDDVKN